MNIRLRLLSNPPSLFQQFVWGSEAIREIRVIRRKKAERSEARLKPCRVLLATNLTNFHKFIFS